MKKYVLISLVTLLAGCSVKQSSVVNEPPKIEELVVTFGSETGSMKSEEPTLFLWPANWTEEQARKGTKELNSASRNYADLGLQIMKLKLALAQTWGTSVAQQCATNFSQTPPTDSEAAMEEQEILFVDASAVAPEKSEAYAACVKNQETRAQIKATKDQLGSQAGPLLGTIVQTIDPDQSNVQNWKSLKWIKFAFAKNDDGSTKVQVSLNSFLSGSKNQTSEKKGPGQITDVSYNAQTRMLKFKVPVLDKSGAETGEVYSFALERVRNIFEYNKPGKDEQGNDTQTLVEVAAFKGDVTVTKPGQPNRLGSAQFTGEWVP